MSISPKETRPLPYPFNRDCGPRNLTWSDQNPLNGAESYIELPIDNSAMSLRELECYLGWEIAGGYHERIHSALMRSPLAIWREHEERVRLRMPHNRPSSVAPDVLNALKIVEP